MGRSPRGERAPVLKSISTPAFAYFIVACALHIAILFGLVPASPWVVIPAGLLTMAIGFRVLWTHPLAIRNVAMLSASVRLPRGTLTKTTPLSLRIVWGVLGVWFVLVALSQVSHFGPTEDARMHAFMTVWSCMLPMMSWQILMTQESALHCAR